MFISNSISLPLSHSNGVYMILFHRHIRMITTRKQSNKTKYKERMISETEHDCCLYYQSAPFVFVLV